ncbi:MAG: carboxypeptidase regulatory-like domain-containing protein, partial [Acidobacteria bacterium]|nr:carboxypeptidase regulatory-like domain-containing protein [Acidobacteriota bacterium]
MNEHRKVCFSASLICASVLLFSHAALAQSTTSIRGTVLDPTNAVIPGVNVTLENVGTGAVRTAITDDTGSYQILQVPPGSYRIRAELSGFKTVVQQVQLLVNTPATLNLRFTEVGEIAE